MLRALRAVCVLCIACVACGVCVLCVLRITCNVVLRVACCVLRVACYEVCERVMRVWKSCSLLFVCSLP